MHYLVEFKTEHPENWDDTYLSPEGDRGWAILEAESEEALRRNLADRGEIEGIQPVLPAREYAVILDARADLENAKARFVDDPSGALAEARRSVGMALEARGYPPPERAEEAPGSRQEILQEYQNTTVDDTDNLEEMRSAFNRLSALLERMVRT
jgi:hypothetical protein